MRSCALLFAVIIWAAVEMASAQQLKLPVTADNSIVMVDGEWSENGGSKGRIRVKANQHIVAMAFDMSAIKGQLVKKAMLVCAKGEHAIAGVTLSTIATPWDELRSNGLTAGIDGIQDWGYHGARFPAVMGGNAFTIAQQSDSQIRDGIYYWDVAPDIVHAMAIGVAHGIAIHEHDADVSRNPTIFSREQSAQQPYLLVELANAAHSSVVDSKQKPLPPTDLRITDSNSLSASLVLTPPKRGFAYEVLVDGNPLGRHNIPLVSQAESQVIFLRDLPESIQAGKPYEISVNSINRLGERSEPARILSTIFEASTLESPQVEVAAKQADPIANLSVVPVLDKYDADGSPVGVLPEDYREHNVLFDGQRVRLIAAAGEVVGFQMLLRGTRQADVSVKLDDFSGRIELQQAIYVPTQGRMIPDPLIPLSNPLSLKPDADQAVVVDVYVPFDASPGIRRGRISLSDGRIVPIEMEVLPFALPRKASFLCEMNSYGLPDHVDDFYALQRIAYDHRLHVNILHYSHHTAAAGARKSNLDMRLRSGKRMDNKRYDAIEPNAVHGFWSDFVSAFGPYLDGSLFADGHRGPIPAPAFYLTFHESWPLNCRPYFNGNLDAFKAFNDAPAYERTYDNILRDFRKLAAKNGWNQTRFQVYFNNKGSLEEVTKAPWILDEPSSYWDYRALRFFEQLSHRSSDVAPGVPIDFRIDISRPEFCRGQLNSGQDLWVVSSWAFENYRRLVTDRIEQHGLHAWVYGTSNHVHESNRNIQAWALDAWQHGATGIVPWQTINKSGSAMREADQLGLFIYVRETDGQLAIRHSLRLKAYREAEQLIEYLKLAQQRRGWTMEQMRQFVAQYVDLDARIDKSNEADAGTSSYSRVAPHNLEILKRAAAKL